MDFWSFAFYNAPSLHTINLICKPTQVFHWPFILPFIHGRWFAYIWKFSNIIIYDRIIVRWNVHERNTEKHVGFTRLVLFLCVLFRLPNVENVMRMVWFWDCIIHFGLAPFLLLCSFVPHELLFFLKGSNVFDAIPCFRFRIVWESSTFVEVVRRIFRR